jgi:hypothetical protein
MGKVAGGNGVVARGLRTLMGRRGIISTAMLPKASTVICEFTEGTPVSAVYIARAKYAKLLEPASLLCAHTKAYRCHAKCGRGGL